MAIVKVIEILAQSEKSWDDAARVALEGFSSFSLWLFRALQVQNRPYSFGELYLLTQRN